MRIDADTVRRLRRDTSGVSGVVHLNNAGAAFPSTQTLDAQIAHLRLEASIGGCPLRDRQPRRAGRCAYEGGRCAVPRRWLPGARSARRRCRGDRLRCIDGYGAKVATWPERHRSVVCAELLPASLRSARDRRDVGGLGERVVLFLGFDRGSLRGVRNVDRRPDRSRRRHRRGAGSRSRRHR